MGLQKYNYFYFHQINQQENVDREPEVLGSRQEAGGMSRGFARDRSIAKAIGNAWV